MMQIPSWEASNHKSERSMEEKLNTYFYRSASKKVRKFRNL